ncbi:YbaB/EbfC family nucleoid-associated protein [Nocardia beijingensis]|uniref:YbaB/EbfC family nucleoid-associated protein n=1 Tax=Nocardia beijingensis TaxID=95162 RepID=UPI0018934F6B|nr:YbaB/EbfC family nucleoid-associated protein [Nocardia beijingensis]MBF6468891.1 YbaB/EbfC family nucleoid-associated protein [Nocardia beijingensis]
MAAFDVHHAAEDLARMAADFERRAERFQELESRMQTLTVTESGKDDRVRVTVDGSGAPTAIDLSPSSRGMDPAVLSAEIMACLRRAQSALRVQVGELVRSTVGDDEAGTAITAQYAERFPDPEPRTSAPFEDRAASSSGHSSSMTSSPFPAQPGPAPSEPTASPRSRKPNRDQIVVPDEPDPETEYYNRSWLV